jgi:hypothetical protein
MDQLVGQMFCVAASQRIHARQYCGDMPPVLCVQVRPLPSPPSHAPTTTAEGGGEDMHWQKSEVAFGGYRMSSLMGGDRMFPMYERRGMYIRFVGGEEGFTGTRPCRDKP